MRSVYTGQGSPPEICHRVREEGRKGAVDADSKLRRRRYKPSPLELREPFMSWPCQATSPSPIELLATLEFHCKSSVIL